MSDWTSIRANGLFPAPSAVGSSSPYWRILPAPSMVGAASPFPGPLALNAGPRALNAGPRGINPGLQALGAASTIGSTPGELGRAAIRRTRNAGAGVTRGLQSLTRSPGAARLSAGTASRAATPAAARAVLRSATPGLTAGLGGAGTPMTPVTGGGGGVMGMVRTAMGLPAAEGAGLRAATAGMIPRLARGGGIGIAGAMGGNLLDESSLFGGSEGVVNDSASKALKWGAAGAGIGTIIPGIGTVAGGLIGAGVGLGHEFLERQGVLSAPTIREQVNETITEADTVAREIGLPPEVMEVLRSRYQAQDRFADPDDKATRIALAQEYADAVEKETVAFATDPDAYLRETTTESAMDPERQFALQAVMVNAVKPYADQYLAQSNATADALENMAAGAGDLAPIYQQYAAQQRQMGAMYAGNMVQSAQISPYMAALEQQASYLNQISQQTMQQAIGAVSNPQGPAAGSTDLTAIIDQATSQLQPN